MRIGVLSDVHANLPALRAVLRTLERRGVDQLLVAGDMMGYGSEPNECVTTLAEAGARCVLGNHDLFILDRLPPTRFPAYARQAADLHRSLLSAEVRSLLESLPTVLRAGSVLMTHASLDSPEEYVTRKRRALELLARLPQEAPGAETLVLGRTHRQWSVDAVAGTLPTGGTVTATAAWLINPGSVGQSRQHERRPRARCAIYDDTARSVEFLQLDYDVAASREGLQRLGLPDRCVHAPPPLRWAAALWAQQRLQRTSSRFHARKGKQRPGP